ncbi:hypothetical protein BAOM_3067 [Peribacillus asahii]|uniref:Uncharacterized protein n=1 Tax=Peribacillus asahii TaxID=228899 RepID=A0A3T0KTD1_9BACI|nr:hypothetical protein [Peribacillus asahii]AZV43676.1 hypothetical protein BAOM_3067 [Peribacillus asahii]
MNKTISKYDEMVKKYATSDVQEEYIYNLGSEVFEEVYETIEYMENHENKKVTYEDVLEQALVYCIVNFDYNTRYKVEELSKLVSYTLLHEVASDSEFSIEQDEFGNTTVNIKMKDENFVVMSLVGTLEELKDFMREQGVAYNINITDLEGNKY